ncbi:Glycosyl transferase family 4 [Candidatus Accumulibacter aalborgensis]|uniref:Glycosyl transferase family 4 n=1 Tax=Candidatus Accumulibacter aalborgensis TaxID=1860102 RepID=A0A1A8XV65_9PROT|nr:Glycosyl transferase family 4 [Candidatus Accumulibacter aalborgensis]
MSISLFFGICVFISIVTIRIAMSLMGHFGILDQPGGHKQHDISTPFTGGFGVFAVLIAAIYLTPRYFPDISLHPLHVMALGGAILFATGLADDIWNLNFRTRFFIQGLVAMLMIVLGGVELQSLGQLALGNGIKLGVWAAPFTVFATVGLINAFNMIDGIDGISGSLAFISLGFVALVAGFAGNNVYLLLIIAVMGGVAGFLYFNLRYPSNSRARVFLGDNGSMLLGFVLAWLFIALSQGEQRAMTPVTALWLFGVPLIDTIGVMLRRLSMGKSPFCADRNHLHHLFIRAGFRVNDTVWIISLVQTGLGAIGIAGLLLAVPEYLMFGLFLVIFAAYFYFTVQPWRVVPALRRANLALGLPSAHAHGVFIGHFPKAASREILAILRNELGCLHDYRISLHRNNHKALAASNTYGMVEIVGNENEASLGEIRRLMARIKLRLDGRPGVQVRLLMQRTKEHDRRDTGAVTDERAEQVVRNREGERRKPQYNTEIYSTVGDKSRTKPGAAQVQDPPLSII